MLDLQGDSQVLEDFFVSEALRESSNVVHVDIDFPGVTVRSASSASRCLPA